jgi:Protein of unknown function, DUF481
MRSFALLLIFAAAALAADQVVLKNGDVITGAIVKKSANKLTIKSEFLGEVTMPWSAVKSVRSDEPVTVELPDGQRIAGKLSTAGENLEVATDLGVKPATFSTVGDIRNAAEQRTWERLQHPGIFELWTGFFDTGLAVARGNARTDTLTNAFNATRATRSDKITVTFSQIYGTATVNNLSSAVANAVRGGWSYDHNLTSRFFVSSLNDYEHDVFQSLDLRFVLGGGAGINAIKSERTALALSSGGDYEHENFFQGLNRNSAEINFGDVFTHKFTSTMNLTQSFRYFVNLSQAGEYRVNFDVGAVTALKKWLGWHVTASNRFLSNPVFGRQRNDMLLSTGFRLSFSH